MTLRDLVSRTSVYVVAGAGPIAFSASQFFLSFTLLHRLSTEEFGSLSFLLILLQFSLGLAGALFSAPFPLLFNEKDREQVGVLQVFFACNLLFSLANLVVQGLISISLGLSTTSSVLFALYAFLMSLRWFARTVYYVQRKPVAVLRSDLIYCTVLMTGLIFGGDFFNSIEGCAGFLVVSALLAMVGLGGKSIALQLRLPTLDRLVSYAEIWRTHAKWSLTGVLTTELTANAHSYIVALALGPAAFAPVAATSLLIRPVTLATNALGDFERPRLARLISSNSDPMEINRIIDFFRIVLGATWIICAAASLGVMILSPHTLFPANYDQATLTTGVFLWLMVAAARSLRTPEGVLLQAAGYFRVLAYTTYWACVFSVLGVFLLTFLGGPIWSIAAIVVGEMVTAFGVIMASRKVFRSAKPSRTPAQSEVP
jgi:hypothetical protein